MIQTEQTAHLAHPVTIGSGTLFTPVGSHDPIFCLNINLGDSNHARIIAGARVYSDLTEKLGVSDLSIGGTDTESYYNIPLKGNEEQVAYLAALLQKGGKPVEIRGGTSLAEISRDNHPDWPQTLQEWEWSLNARTTSSYQTTQRRLNNAIYPGGRQ